MQRVANELQKKLLITGESGSGKTQFCAGVVNALRQGDLQRIDIRGILSPGLVRQDEKVGIQAVNLVTFEHKNLAEINEGDEDSLSTKRWRFDPKVIAWCNSVFSKSTPCDVLIVDELGPLEFEREQGFTAALEAIDSEAYKLALVVVRPHLLKNAQERWPHTDVLDVQKLKNEPKAIDEIVHRIEV